MHQVVVADSAFTEGGVRAGTASGDHYRGRAMLEEIVGMIQAGAKNRRRASRILRRSEDDDGIRRMNFLQAGFVHDAKADDRKKDCQRHRGQRHHPQGPGVVPHAGSSLLQFILARKTRKSPAPQWRLPA